MMLDENKAVELKEEDLKKVSGGDEKTVPHGTEENTDKATLENLQDNKGADE